MTYHGRVRDGMIVLDGDVRLPEGVDVEVAVSESPAESVSDLGQALLRHAGKATNLPADAARNHDHYLYGTAKR